MGKGKKRNKEQEKRRARGYNSVGRASVQHVADWIPKTAGTRCGSRNV